MEAYSNAEMQHACAKGKDAKTNQSAPFSVWSSCFHTIFQLLLLPIWSSSSMVLLHQHKQPYPTTRLEREVIKMKTKFLEWSVKNGHDAILWVDGNNVRGRGQFEWTPLEVQNRVARFCLDHHITKTVIVWDHGTCPFVCSRTFPWKALHNNNTSSFDLEMVTLFSGLSNRADRVILQEFKRLVSTEMHAVRSMAFVTSDRELNFKLRRQSVWRTSRESVDETLCDTSMHSTPLFCDSTRFLDLLRTSRTNSDWMDDERNEAMESRILDAKQSMSLFHKQQRRRYNPKREKTWERVVLAETFRRCLCMEYLVTSFTLQSILHSTFSNAFLSDLQSRGYVTSNSTEKKIVDSVGAMRIGDYQVPSRLDKQQKRSLTRYNRFLTVK
jgi:hypothetical protein